MKKFLALLILIQAGAFVYAQKDTTVPVPATRDTTPPAVTTPVPVYRDTTPPTVISPLPSSPAPGSPAPKKKDWSKVSLANRSNDHFMVQVGYDNWLNKPDSIMTKGLSRSLNIYFMLDFPFKTNPRFSIGIGAGISGSSIYFDNTIIGIAGAGTRMAFRNVADTNQYKKYKLATTYAEVPVELRFTADPQNNGKSFKVAIGGKVGTMLNAHTKGKNLESKAGSTLNSFTVKESSKRFFNSTRLAATARVGYGVFSIFGVYQINNFLKEGAGPDVRPFTVGIAFSGL